MKKLITILNILMLSLVMSIATTSCNDKDDVLEEVENNNYTGIYEGQIYSYKVNNTSSSKQIEALISDGKIIYFKINETQQGNCETYNIDIVDGEFLFTDKKSGLTFYGYFDIENKRIKGNWQSLNDMYGRSTFSLKLKTYQR